MAQENNIQFTIRKYTTSDGHAVLSLFHDGILEHVYPAFFKAMSHPDHVGVALSISMVGYVLGGSTYFQALLFGSAWAGLIYYCCHEICEGYMARRLSTDMADIQANYLDNPDNSFWVAEADVKGQQKVVGILAVMGKRGGEEVGRFDDWNGGVIGDEFDQDAGDGSCSEIVHMVVAFSSRRKTLGSQLMQTAMDFCKEQGYARLVLDISSPQQLFSGYKNLALFKLLPTATPMPIAGSPDWLE